MNINPDFNNQDECPPADEVMANGMDFLFENLIEPMQEKLNQDQLKILSLIGISFKIIADQAAAYENLEQSMKGLDTNEDFSRN